MYQNLWGRLWIKISHSPHGCEIFVLSWGVKSESAIQNKFSERNRAGLTKCLIALFPFFLQFFCGGKGVTLQMGSSKCLIIKVMNSAKNNIVGEQFGRLTVVESTEKSMGGTLMFACICECGNKTLTPGHKLITGHTRSCGCLRKENMRRIVTTHGQAETRFWRIFMGIKSRCSRRSEPTFKYYGALGVRNEWERFEDFQRDMHQSYLVHVNEHGERQTTIEREDVRGNYSKENCRWATYKEQERNRRNNRMTTFNGETLCSAEWSERTGISPSLLSVRFRNGWSVERTLTTPVHFMKSRNT